MVGNQTDGHVVLVILFVGLVSQIAHVLTQSVQGIHVKDGIHILHHNGQTLQAHTGIDILLLQGGVVAGAIVLKLGEHVVPHFHITIALATNLTVRAAAAVLLTAVVVDLRARAAGTCAVLPEVIRLTKTENTIGRNADFLVPNIKRLVILHVNRGIQTLGIQADDLGQELPRPSDSLVLEVITKREVTQHLKESTVTGGLTHVLDIAGTDTLLAGSHAGTRRNLCAGEIGLQGSHTCIDQQQALIVVRHQREAGQTQMLLAFKERQIHLAQFVNTILFQFFCHRSFFPFCRWK